MTSTEAAKSLALVIKTIALAEVYVKTLEGKHPGIFDVSGYSKAFKDSVFELCAARDRDLRERGNEIAKSILKDLLENPAHA